MFGGTSSAYRPSLSPHPRRSRSNPAAWRPLRLPREQRSPSLGQGPSSHRRVAVLQCRYRWRHLVDLRGRGKRQLQGHGAGRLGVRLSAVSPHRGLPVTDNIGDTTERANGTAVLRIEFSDGKSGVLTVGCHGPGAPPGIFEGIATTKGFTTFYNVPVPPGNANTGRTLAGLPRVRPDAARDDVRHRMPVEHHVQELDGPRHERRHHARDAIAIRAPHG
jgi:hypothetical protein